MNVRPLRDRVLVKRIEAQEQRIGEIIVPTPPKKNRNKQKSSPLATGA
jgi:co-chaperonin GroES (HSP10)